MTELERIKKRCRAGYPGNSSAALVQANQDVHFLLLELDKRENGPIPDGLTQAGSCVRCGAKSGDDWQQCEGICPVRGSPHFDALCLHAFTEFPPITQAEFTPQDER